jgi:hypothetical protein
VANFLARLSIVFNISGPSPEVFLPIIWRIGHQIYRKKNPLFERLNK